MPRHIQTASQPYLTAVPGQWTPCHAAALELQAAAVGALWCWVFRASRHSIA